MIMKRLFGQDRVTWVLAIIAMMLTFYYFVVVLTPASVAAIVDAAGRYN